MSGLISKALFSDRGTYWLSKLDNDKSMFSIAVRDGVDGSLRALIEEERDPHGGRERLIEEGLTTLIWGFGINLMKTKVYDPLVRKLTPVKIPHLDMQLIEKGAINEFHTLAADFQKTFPNVPHYKEIMEVATDAGKRKWYLGSGIVRFLSTTLALTLLVSLGVPTFNQWLTRKKLNDENERKSLQFGHKPLQTSFHKPKLFEAFENGVLPNIPTASQPVVKGLHFGGALTNGLYQLLQNEQYNTLLVDGTLLSGRSYKARNNLERAEIIFRELSIIFFLYFAQRPIQDFIGKLFNRITNSVTQFNFDTLNFLKKVAFKSDEQFLNEYHHAKGFFNEVLPTSDVLKNDKLFNDFIKDKSELNQWSAKLKKVIQSYYLQKASQTSAADNLLIKTAEAGGFIQTIEHEGKRLLDISQEIQTKDIFKLIHAFETLSGKLKPSGEALLKAVESNSEPLVETLLKKSRVGRFSAMMAANLVCAFFVAYLCPKIQHYITYKKTGKDMFPGVEQ